MVGRSNITQDSPSEVGAVKACFAGVAASLLLFVCMHLVPSGRLDDLQRLTVDFRYDLLAENGSRSALGRDRDRPARLCLSEETFATTLATA